MTSQETRHQIIPVILKSLVCGIIFTSTFFKFMSRTDISCPPWEISLGWIPRNLTNEKSTLVQGVACCHQKTRHCLSLCWPRTISPFGVTRPQVINVYSFKIISVMTHLILWCSMISQHFNSAMSPTMSSEILLAFYIITFDVWYIIYFKNW